MSAILRVPAIGSVHDQIVSSLAQRWAKAFQGRVTINTCLEQNRWAWVDQKADIMGWMVSPRGNSIQWIAEVETEESLSESTATSRWKRGAELRVPFYLFVPRGQKNIAQKAASAAEVAFNGIYEYAFVNGVLQLL